LGSGPFVVFFLFCVFKFLILIFQ